MLATNSQAQANMPWFRVHIVILNDPGRLISVHQMHSGFVAGWSGVMLCYELITVDAALFQLWMQQILYIIQYGDKVVMECHLFHV